jgi:diguanylate cyclase (GGDEF)-like protein
VVRSPLVRTALGRAALVRPPLVWSFVDRRLTRYTLRALIAATSVAAFVLWHEVVRDLPSYGADVRIPWWALAAGFAATELFVIHAHVRGSAHSLSLSELPLVLGLLLAAPSDLVLAMVVGPAVVLVCTRGQSPMRLLFNLAQFALTATLAIITLHAIAPAPADIGPAVWGATFVAVLAASATAAVLVFCAIGLSEGSIPSRKLAGMLGADLLVALTNTSVALAGATVVAHDLTAGWLLIPPATVLLLAYRAWVSERAKHQSLEFLYGVTRSLSRGGELEAELLDLLRRTRASFRVEAAELVLLPGADVGALRTARGRGGVEEAMVPVAHAAAAALRAAVEHAGAVRVERDRCEPELRNYLTERGIEEALIAPVHGETRLAGVMVLGDRVGATDPFTDEDLRLFEALAAHAGLSLELDRLERQAQSDPLTGLANRTLFLRRVEASLERGSGMATVLFLDLDDFKAINDRAGHAAGDAVLVAAAGRIEASVRPGDIAARMGGDEFAVLLEDVDDHHGEQVAGRILHLLAEPVVVDGEELWVRSSVGIATAAAGSLGSGELLHRADVAMYRAKEAGKSQMRVWLPEMHAAGDGALTGRDELAEALRRGELVAHFQPIVSLAGGGEVAAEALARWHHPRLGLLGAGSFMLDAEGDLASAVDREVLFQACAAAARGDVPAVHVNLAGLDAATVRDVLESTALDPSRLVLELTERALRSAPVDGLEALRAIGVRIAFDDFGSGRHGVELLRERPVDILKIARPFVDGAGRAGHDRAVLSMVVQLGAMFSLQVVAQGIEREDQREALASLGCELGQGYLLGRPLPLGAAVAA